MAGSEAQNSERWPLARNSKPPHWPAYETDLHDLRGPIQGLNIGLQSYDLRLESPTSEICNTRVAPQSSFGRQDNVGMEPSVPAR